MIKRYLLMLVLGFVLIAPTSSQRNPNIARYHTVKAKKGDGVYTLLRRYHLDIVKCNIEQFYSLNDLNLNSSLHYGEKYKIPVLIYSYNGKSIRSTLKIDDLQKALRIKTFNEKILKSRLRRSNFIESRILWVPHDELFCNKNDPIIVISSENTTKINKTKNSDKEPSKVIPSPDKKEVTTELKNSVVATTSTPKTEKIKILYVPLFGKGNDNVAIENYKLQDRVFYLVSGHGGPDPGARCTDCDNTLCEDEYAYDVILRLAKNLMSRGAIVHVIIQDTDGIRDGDHLLCDTDEKCLGKLKIPRSQKLRLMQRSTAINDLYFMYKKRGIKEQRTISIHVDSNKKDKKMDTYFCFYKYSSRSKEMALNLKNTFKKKYAKYQKSRDYHGKAVPKGYYILKNTMPPAVLVELANIKNPKNQKRITMTSNRQALADWMFEGLTGLEL